MAPKPKLKTPAIQAPQTPQENAVRISNYGALQARRAALVAEMSERQRGIGEEYQADISLIDAALREEHLAIQMFCEAHRGELAEENGVKYIEFTTGRVEWRKQPDIIAAPTKPDTQDTVFSLLEQRGLHRFIRVKREINKEAMLAEKGNLAGLIAGIPGLSLRTGSEAFTIKPLETNPS